MATEDRPTRGYENWLEAKRKMCPRLGQGGRLDRFASVVMSNPGFKSIFEAENGNRQAGGEVDQVDGATASSEVDRKRTASPEQGPDELATEINLLLEAVKIGCLAALPDSVGRHVNKSAGDGITALHVAVEHGYCEEVKVLLNKKAEITADGNGLTPLHVAAASTEPNPKIAKLLIRHIKPPKTPMSETGNKLISATVSAEAEDTSIRGNTALHFAANNEQISREFIERLKYIDPSIKNNAGETAFHMAAKAENPDVIVWMLEVFTPAKYGWEMKSIETESGPKLLEICAEAGNAKAVALLIKYGADISQRVLFKSIDQSVENPSKTDKLIDVYRTITENCVHWDWLKTTPEERQLNYPRLGTEPVAHREKQREVMSSLLTNAGLIEHAIVKGDKVFLNEILNTSHVFRFTETGLSHRYKYDVTSFLPTSRNRRKISQIICNCRPATVEPAGEHSHSYLDLIAMNEHLWKNTDILQVEPFYAITRPICAFMQVFYFLVGVILLTQMTVFTIYYMPPDFRLINWLNFNISAGSNASKILPDPSVVDVSTSDAGWNSLWLIWPTVIWIGTLFVRLCRTRWAEIVYGFLSLRFLFAVVLWAWYFSTFVSHQFSLSFTSAVLFSGWLVTLSFFINSFKKASIFSFLLKEIIVKDILFSFGIVFAFVLVSFSSAIHLLRTEALLYDQSDFLDTMYHVFASALTTGDFMGETKLESDDDKRRIHLLRALFAIYLCSATIMLLNLLISMMNNRYDKARQKAKNVWTFETVHAWIILTTVCKLFTLERILKIFNCYWRIVTHEFWKFFVGTRYDEVSINKCDYDERTLLHLKYSPTIHEKKMLKVRKLAKLEEISLVS